MRFAALLALACAAAGVSMAAQRGPAPAAIRPRLDPAVIGLACAPSVVFEPPAASLLVTGSQDSFVRRTHAEGDLITINAGRANGLEVGQEFYTRRVLLENRRPATPDTPGVVRTTGWIRIYAVDDTMSLATITHSCETVDVGDYLEPFVLPAPPAQAAERLPAERDNYGRILVGADRRGAFGSGDYMVVDRGSNHGVAPGARFAIYRDRDEPGNFLFDLGEAVAVEVKAETSTLLVTVARDAMLAGDLVALRR
ncbi:MAG: hypothetical protein AB7K63_15740 [Vicinamibacterales bacterium]